MVVVLLRHTVVAQVELGVRRRQADHGPVQLQRAGVDAETLSAGVGPVVSVDPVVEDQLR